jgi:phospholipase C
MVKGYSLFAKLVVAVCLLAIVASQDAATQTTLPSSNESHSNANSKKSLSDMIKHVFVLMMENRSFDHLLGWLKEDAAASTSHTETRMLNGLRTGMSCPIDPNDA